MRDSRTRRTLVALVVAIANLGTGVGTAVAVPTPAPIIGGNVASITDYPWQVALVNPTADTTQPPSSRTHFLGQFCGGSIINARWILTAAHCLEGYTLSRLTIFAGNADLSTPLGTNDYSSRSWVIHPQYSGEFNDVALIRLDSPIDLSGATRRAIALPLAVDANATPALGDNLVASGWGEQVAYNTDNYPLLLRATTLQVLAGPSATTCGAYPDSGWNPLAEMCVGRTDGSADTCQGDSGGPYAALGLDGNGDGVIEPTLLGITSWGEGCASANYPGIATRVTSYVDWIVPRPPSLSVSYLASKSQYTLSVVTPPGLVAMGVTAFRVESSTNGTSWSFVQQVSGNRRTISEKGAPGLQWRIAALSAVNDGLGPYRWATTAGPQIDNGSGVPDAPLNFQQVGSSSKYATLTWSRPESTNGSAIWEYRVYQRVGQLTKLVDKSTSGRLGTISRVTKGADVWVVAVNNAGVSTESNHLIAY